MFLLRPHKIECVDIESRYAVNKSFVSKCRIKCTFFLSINLHTFIWNSQYGFSLDVANDHIYFLSELRTLCTRTNFNESLTKCYPGTRKRIIWHRFQKFIQQRWNHYFPNWQWTLQFRFNECITTGNPLGKSHTWQHLDISDIPAAHTRNAIWYWCLTYYPITFLYTFTSNTHVWHKAVNLNELWNERHQNPKYNKLLFFYGTDRATFSNWPAFTVAVNR